MKICSIEFENHPILGNLKLDFTDKKGNPVDTIILAGENGCGKTTILEELYNLWDTGKNNSNYKGRYITTKIFLNKEEIKQVIQKVLEANRNDIMPKNPSGFFIIKSDLATSAWRCFDIKYQQIETESLVSASCFLMGYIQPFAQSIFSPVDINYHSRNITSIQATNLDSDKSGRKKSDQNLAENINQMLVDINALDNSDLAIWVDEHSNQIPPVNIAKKRIKRFSEAFSQMFDDLDFYKVDNINNAKTILFKRRNAEIPISQLSSGEKQIVYRGAYLLKDIQLDLGKAVLIDEPEISLHPEWQKKILGYYQSLFTDETGKQLSQIFVATHSPFIIHNPNRHNDKVVVLKKDDNGDIFQSDKPEYYDCNSFKAIEDSFSVYDFSSNKNIPFVFLEGRTDEMYFKKAKELFGNKTLEYTFQWVGHLKDDGNEEFTGKDSLNKLKLFILGNKNIFPDKNILIYDCDTNKKTESISENLVVKTLEKQNGQRYNAGIENLLVIPQDFDYDKYYKTTKKYGEYGEAKNMQEFKKMDLAKDICGSYAEAQQREILQKIGDVVIDIERELFGA